MCMVTTGNQGDNRRSSPARQSGCPLAALVGKVPIYCTIKTKQEACAQYS